MHGLSKALPTGSKFLVKGGGASIKNTENFHFGLSNVGTEEELVFSDERINQGFYYGKDEYEPKGIMVDPRFFFEKILNMSWVSL